MYEDFSNVNIAAELRLYETICRHTGQEAAADLAKRASEIIDELIKERDALNAQYTKAIYEVMPNWTPVTERLPEGKDGNYIVAIKTSRGVEVHEAYYYKAWDSYEWYDPVEEYQKYDVTHWMPLPKPPEECET